MKATYDLNAPGSGCLIITATADDREAIRKMVEDHGCECCRNCEYDALEGLIANSELAWIDPCEIGALTDAPILGIREQEQEVPNGAEPWRITSAVDGKRYYEPVLAAWGFMDYQLRSFLQDLVENGKAVFTN